MATDPQTIFHNVPDPPTANVYEPAAAGNDASNR